MFPRTWTVSVGDRTVTVVAGTRTSAVRLMDAAGVEEWRDFPDEEAARAWVVGLLSRILAGGAWEFEPAEPDRWVLTNVDDRDDRVEIEVIAGEDSPLGE